MEAKTIKKDHILELEVRRAIYNFILKYPGVYFSEISREMKVSKNNIAYHLHYLKKRDLLVEKSVDRYTQYYAARKIGREHIKAINILRIKTPLHIVLFLSLYHKATRKDLSHDLDKSRSTISHYLNKLIELDIVEKFLDNNKVKYRLKNEKATDKILIQYKKSLLDEWVNYLFNYIDKVRADKLLLRLHIFLNRTDITKSDELEKIFFEIFSHPYYG